MTRKAVFAGQFYEANSFALERQLNECFLSKFGPGTLPISKRSGFVKAIIAPHAGYMYSGACAAWAYKEIGEAEIPDLYILLGPSHSGYGSGISLESIETPLGLVRIDQNFAKDLLNKSDLVVSEAAHSSEHCLEVQLPFLQFVNKKFEEKIKILPIVVSHDIDLKKLSLDLKETIMDSNKKVTVIISSDFTHYGQDYGFVPFTKDIAENQKKLDLGAFEFIKSLDVKGFTDYVGATGATICGAMPIAVLLGCLKQAKAELLRYYASGDVAGDYRNSVGYMSVMFK